jgi:hypothetical protein
VLCDCVVLHLLLSLESSTIRERAVDVAVQTLSSNYGSNSLDSRLQRFRLLSSSCFAECVRMWHGLPQVIIIE